MSSSPPPGQDPDGWGQPAPGGRPGDGRDRPGEAPRRAGWGEPAPSQASWGQPTPEQGGWGGSAPRQGGWNQPAPSPGGGWNQPAPGQAGWGAAPGGWSTAQAPPIANLASWGARVGAYLLDAVILLVPLAIVYAIAAVIAAATSTTTIDQLSGTSSTSLSAVGIIAIVVALLAAIVVGLAYHPFFLSRWNGQTPGRRMVNVRVVRDDGHPVTVGFALLRELVIKGLLFGSVGGLLCYVPTILNFLWPLWDDRNEALHDKVAKTHVLRA